MLLRIASNKAFRLLRHPFEWSGILVASGRITNKEAMIESEVVSENI